MKTIIKHLSRRSTAVLLAGVAIITGLALEHNGPTPAAENSKPTPINLKVDDHPLERSARSGNSYAPVVKQVGPSVVKISTTVRAREAWQSDGNNQDDPIFRRFFGPGATRRGQSGAPQAPRQQGVGSGVIVTADGYILTNNHVVENADQVKVGLTDGREFTAKVVGKDPKTDVAVIKVNATDLPFLSIADSDRIEVGDMVLALGNPFGIGQTVTTGIVSARSRGGLGLDYEDFIQTDAAINPGNSGGALVDTEGRLVGINTAIISRTGGNEGIGFAIPSNLARYVMESLVKDGKLTRGYMGVLIQDVTPALAKEFKLKETTGALVGDLTPKGPAEKGGLKSGDIIVEFNGKPVHDSRQLKLQVSQTSPGTEVPVKVLRDGDSKKLDVTLKELPGSEDVAKDGAESATDSGTLNGVTVVTLDKRSRGQLEVPANLHGAVVTEVDPNSPSAEAGLRSGDVILEINRQPVKDADDAVRLTTKTKEKTTLLRIWRHGNTQFVVVDESEKN